MIDFDQKDLDQFHEYMAKRDADRIELEQYRAIFAGLSTALTNAASVHLYRAGADGRFGVRVLAWNQATRDEDVESVTGATLRDAMAQAAQVVA